MDFVEFFVFFHDFCLLFLACWTFWFLGFLGGVVVLVGSVPMDSKRVLEGAWDGWVCLGVKAF